MRRWNRLTKHFGEVPAEVTLDFTFEPEGWVLDEEVYDSHEESCTCIEGKWDGTKMHASFDVGALGVDPNGVVPYRQSTKSITVKWKSGKTDTLYLKAIIYHPDQI
jgi:hypothetical protein